MSDPALDHGPAMIADTSELAGMTFGTIELPDLVGFSGQIQDVSGNPIGGAGIHCTEVGFEQRTWSDFSNEEGRYALTLPPLPMTCTMIPPGDRTDLAWTSETIDTSIDEGHVFEIRTGIRASGTVRLRSEVEPFSVVEIRDGLGALLGAALTDQDGQFSAQVDVDPGLGAR